MAPATITKLKEILHDQHQCNHLKIELVINVDAGEAFAKDTYALEGDGPLVLYTYEEITKVPAAIATAYYPNTQAIALKISNGNASVFQLLLSYTTCCVQPPYDYFQVWRQWAT